jgi:hypothetical protein
MLQKICLFLLVLVSLSGHATHLRSGEISYQPVPGQPNTYLITFTMYTNAAPGIVADLNVLTPNVNLGDGTVINNLQRQNGPAGFVVGKPCAHIGELVTPIIRKNIFTVIHTYANPGTYTISTAPSARNAGITNISNSSGQAMYVSAMLTIGNGVTQMSSPLLSFPPIGDGCSNSIYKINPGAIDPDNDLLQFFLVRCKTTGGSDIASYKYPNEVDGSTFSMDPRSGVITWNSPSIQGEYNISFRIEKWRNGKMIGYVLRDMQVTIGPCVNHPPVIDHVPDICVQAGTPITNKVTTSDADGDTLTFSTTGLPYDLLTSPAIYTPDTNRIGTTSGTFTWNTLNSHFTKNPYLVYYKVSDSHNGSSLSDNTSNFITLIAPSVKNVIATPLQRGFSVRWDQTVCPLATGYNIYRKVDPSNIPFDSCMLGVPPMAGFTLVGTVNGQTNLSFIDSNKGKGLTSGYTYCYVVTAFFDGGTESAPSEPSCALLMYPFISVLKDTLIACLWNTVTLDTTIIQFINADQKTTYTWSSTPELQIISSNMPYPDIKMNKVGIYSIKVVSVSGAYIDSARINFNVYPIPDPKIIIKDLGGMPDSVLYYNRSNFAVRAEWLFYDGTRSSSMDSVLFKYDHNGYFRTYLTVYNSLECPDTTSILYRVVMKGIAMPNAFEPENPNADLNTFKPKALGMETFFLGVWDLWGNLVWSTDKVDNTEPAEGWNGTDSKGRKLPSQNYIWRMKATYIDGTIWKGIKDRFGKFHKEGTFTLLR